VHGVARRSCQTELVIPETVTLRRSGSTISTRRSAVLLDVKTRARPKLAGLSSLSTLQIARNAQPLPRWISLRSVYFNCHARP
jgi:hypothetical protein